VDAGRVRVLDGWAAAAAEGVAAPSGLTYLRRWICARRVEALAARRGTLAVARLLLDRIEAVVPSNAPGAVAVCGFDRGLTVAVLVAGTRRGSRRRARVAACLVAALAAVAALIAPAGAPAAPPDRLTRSVPRLRTALDRLVAAGAPGVVVLVRDGDRTVRLARGVADRARRAPMRVTDRFRVGSVTKTFVATVVLQLAGE